MKIKVKYRKLGRERNWGVAHLADNIIEVDVRCKGKKKLEMLIHESCHLLMPEKEEEEIEEISITLTRLLWSQGFRQIDNSNHVPLQDGKK